MPERRFAMNKLRIAIIGCGFSANGAGPNQIHMPAFSKMHDEVEMVSFCDIVEEKAVTAARKYGTDQAKAYTDYKDILKDDSIDIVDVCTPNKSHAEITIAALEAGKHVYCEKPMAKTYADAQRMVETAKRTGKKLTIGYQYRFRKDSWYLHDLCRRGDLGEIYFAKAHALRRRCVPTWGVFLNEEEQGGGALIDLGTHALDMTLWMMDNYQPTSVMGITYNKFANQTRTANFCGPWDPEKFTVEDSAFGFIRMVNDATIFLEASWALNILDAIEEKVTLCGTKAGADMREGLRINSADMDVLTVNKPAVLPSGLDVFEAPPAVPSGIPFARAWIDCIRNDTDPVVKPEQALVVTQILEAIYKSSKTGKTVYI
jgi:predicted dehydrogenase